MNIFDKIKIRRMLRKKDTYQVIIDSSIADMDTMKYYFKILPKYGFNFVTDKKNGNKNQFVYCNSKRAKKMQALIPEELQLYYDNELYEKIKTDYVCLKCPHYKICSYKGG